jgi:crotonobetaine/carnitine-CoA ligase
MHPYTDFFPRRAPGDTLDCAPLLAHGLRSHPRHEVLRFGDQVITREESRRRVAQFQAWFDELGLVRRDRVAVMLNNGPDHIHLIYALMLSGMVWIPVNTRQRGAGLEYLLQHSDPGLILCEPEFDDLIRELDLADTPCLHLPGFRPDRAGPDLRQADVDPHDLLGIIYTSGTSGPPKGVLFTHRMMRIASEAALLVADVRAGDRVFLWEPLCHIGGAQMLLLPFLEQVSLGAVARFSASRFWEQVRAFGATQLHYLGGVLDILLQMPGQAPPEPRTLRVAWGAGANRDIWEEAESRLGVKLRECYGMTECASFATVNLNGCPGSMGRALPWIELQLLDDKGREVACGEPGEIVLSSKVEGALFGGYLNNPEATRGALRQGRLYTGDHARRDEQGNLYYLGRRTDSMRVRGENVSAWEIERVFARHPQVRACAAIGVAAEVGEQEVLLNVQFEQAPVAWEELHAWAAQRLASFQLPRYYRAVDGFETTASERIRKHLLSRDASDAWDRLRAQARPRTTGHAA